MYCCIDKMMYYRKKKNIDKNKVQETLYRDLNTENKYEINKISIWKVYVPISIFRENIAYFCTVQSYQNLLLLFTQFYFIPLATCQT